MENQNSWKKPLTHFGISLLVLTVIALIAFGREFQPIALAFIVLIQAFLGFIVGIVRALSRKSDSDSEDYGQKILLLSLACLLISFGVCTLKE